MKVEIDFNLINGTLITWFFQIYFGSWGTVYKNSAICTLHTALNFQQICSICCYVRRNVDENLLYGLVAEPMKLLRNSFYGYQLMDR